jgi:putative intracellular protease/amidase
MPRPVQPLIIDLEAPGFGRDSYPIEVGVALDDDRKFCSLIRPQPQWAYWDHEAERVHGIARERLQQRGKPVAEVAAGLNRLLEAKTLYSDGWVADRPWLTRLFHAAGMAMNFRVSPLELILSEEQMARWHEVKQEVLASVEQRRHRASIDAWVVQQTDRSTAAALTRH